MTTVRTERLILRRWEDRDRDAFFAMNSDPKVMEWIGPVMTREQSDAFMDRIEAGWDEHGLGLWCVEVGGESVGFTGLSVPWFRDGVEVGWRLRSEQWGRGYAPEAARAALRTGFDEVGLEEILSFTAVVNANSRRVMEKIGMARHAAGDFDHPGARSDRLRPHVLYRITAEQYRSQV